MMSARQQVSFTARGDIPAVGGGADVPAKPAGPAKVNGWPIAWRPAATLRAISPRHRTSSGPQCAVAA
jgi:hypothetical protein